MKHFGGGSKPRFHALRRVVTLIACCGTLLSGSGLFAQRTAWKAPKWQTRWQHKWQPKTKWQAKWQPNHSAGRTVSARETQRKVWDDAWRARWKKTERQKATLSSAPAATDKTTAIPLSETKPVPNPAPLPASESNALRPVFSPVSLPTAAKPAAVPSFAAPAVPSKGATNGEPKSENKPASAAPQSVLAPAAKPAPEMPVAKKDAAVPAKSAPSPADKGSAALAGTRPDPTAEPKKPVDKPLDSPLSAITDGGKMFLYLIPTVLLMIGALRLLRRFQEKNGRLPPLARMAGPQKTPRPSLAAFNPISNSNSGGLLRGLVSGMKPPKAPERSGTAMRLTESLAIGGANLHLVEVRGRILLISANASGVSLLTEIEERETLANDDFRRMLEQAASDMDTLDLSVDTLDAPLMIGALDDPLRDASHAVTRSARRLRTVQEAEAAFEQERK